MTDNDIDLRLEMTYQKFSGPIKLHVNITIKKHNQTLCEEHNNHTKPALIQGKQQTSGMLTKTTGV
jgi:hypothetical protein